MEKDSNFWSEKVDADKSGTNFISMLLGGDEELLKRVVAETNDKFSSALTKITEEENGYEFEVIESCEEAVKEITGETGNLSRRDRLSIITGYVVGKKIQAILNS